jgi:hypothetical protein
MVTMKLLWAFDFGPDIDPATNQPIPVDIFDEIEVCLLFCCSVRVIT